jgi:gamma-glutamyl:cysteine ligase YbdK (ATP-grasp superfamily)
MFRGVYPRSLVTTNTIQKATQICWDSRLSERYPTLEFRVADMCMTVDESVMRDIVQMYVNADIKLFRTKLLEV